MPIFVQVSALLAGDVSAWDLIYLIVIEHASIIEPWHLMTFASLWGEHARLRNNPKSLCVRHFSFLWIARFRCQQKFGRYRISIYLNNIWDYWGNLGIMGDLPFLRPVSTWGWPTPFCATRPVEIWAKIWGPMGWSELCLCFKKYPLVNSHITAT